MHRNWKFKDFVLDNGENVVLTWLNSLSKRTKQKINTRIESSELEPLLKLPDFKVLQKKECLGLIEMRVTYERNEYRPLCCYGEGNEVVILMGAIEKENKLVPASACATALKRKARLGERGRTRDHDFS